MKKSLLLLAFLCLTAITGRADEQRKITLSSDNIQETVSLSYCNIFVTLVNAENGDDYGKVLIEIENLDESKLLALFHSAYNEKQVKKVKPSFSYDKLFGGTKGKRIIDPYSKEMNKDVFFEPSNKHSLPTFNVEPDKQTVVRLPIYIAKTKNGIIQRILDKQKFILLRKQVIELDIEVTLKPSAEYLALQSEFEALKRDVNNTVFCKKHRTSVEKQQEPYVKRIEELRGKIDGAISAHGWKEGDGGYNRYNAIKEAIDHDIDLDKHIGLCKTHRKDGDRDPQPTHQCTYCSQTLQQIYHKLDDLYKKIYTSNNRQATKASVMSQVEALYKCCTDPGCSKHAAAWSQGNSFKSKIIDRYNRIKGL